MKICDDIGCGKGMRRYDGGYAFDEVSLKGMRRWLKRSLVVVIRNNEEVRYETRRWGSNEQVCCWY